MALWQTDFLLVPRQALAARSGFVPEHVSEEALDSGGWWKGRVLVEEIERLISSICPPRPSWNPHLKTWGEEDGNRIDVLREGEEVVEVSVRIDARAVDDAFVSGVVALATRWDCVLISDRFRVLPPLAGDVLAAIRESSAARFVANPRRFLDSDGSPGE